MREFGYKRCEVWLDANEVKLIEQAAKLVGRKLATFIREAAFGSAAVVVQKSTGNGAWDRDQWDKMRDAKQEFDRDE